MSSKVKTQKETPKPVVKSKTQRFNDVAERRANMVIDKLANLGKITDNPQNYEFTEEQVLEIFSNIQTFTQNILQRFLDCISMSETKEKYKINLKG